MASISKMVRQSELDRRWGFLLPWCEAVKRLITYKRVERDWDVWDERRFFLEVKLPMRCALTEDEDGNEFEFDMEWSGEDTFKAKFRHVREALALLAAVAHVDQKAWKYLLTRHCGVVLGREGDAKFEQDVAADYFLILDQDEDWRTNDEDHMGLDLALFCGVEHRTHPSKEYEDALTKIATLDRTLNPTDAGVDIMIPVRCFYPCHGLSSDGGPKILKNVLKCEQRIHEMWRDLEQEVQAGTLRCTFALKPMIADLDGLLDWPEMVKRIGKLMDKGLFFSEVSLGMQNDGFFRRANTDTNANKLFGQVMAHLFDSTRRIRELNYPWQPNKESNMFQLDTLKLTCNAALREFHMPAMGSAMAVNQTTKNMIVLLSLPTPPDRTASANWWKWIGYGVFSKRARAHSSLESLSLVNIRSLSSADTESFAALLSSEHPEEDLFRSGRGQIDERDATLKANASIRWCDDDGSTLSFPAAIRHVRTFSDDGNSEWVNVIVPGFGKCQVQRQELDFSEVETINTPTKLISLTLSFEKIERTVSDGLPEFLSTVGRHLRSLTLDLPDLSLEEREIIACCPNLETLSICGQAGNLQYHLADIGNCDGLTEAEPIGKISVPTLAGDLSDVDNPLVKCIRQVRVFPSLHLQTFASEMKALVRMLKKNRTLEYIEVVGFEQLEPHIGDLRKQHNKRVKRSIPLPIENKTAFLSVMSSTSEHTKEVKKTKRVSSSQSSLKKLDHHVLAEIFGFASTPVRREVFFHWENDDMEGAEEVLTALFG